MDLLELQQRANVLVDKVNEYEDGLAKFVITEDDYINQHIYCDVYCLRAVMQLLFGSTSSEKLDRTLNKNSALRLFASTAPAWNTSFKINPETQTIYTLDSNLIDINNVPNSNGIYTFSNDNSSFLKYNFEYTNVNQVEVQVSFTLTSDSDSQSIIVFNSSLMFFTVDWASQRINIWSDQGYYYFSYNFVQNQEYTFKITATQSEDNVINVNYYDVNNSTSIGDVTYSGIFKTGSSNYFGTNAFDGSKHDNLTGSINLLDSYIKINDNNPVYFVTTQEVDQGYDVNQTQHQFANDVNLLNSYNLIAHDSYLNELDPKSTRTKSGLNYSYSSNIADALATESQIANMFKWNTTTSFDIPNNTISSNRQVPGIVCYYAGNDINLDYTSTIPYNPQISTLNGVNYNNPSTWGSAYRSGSQILPMPICSLSGSIYSQWSADCANDSSDKQALKFFMTGLNYTRGKLESPQQIWQPDEKYGDDNLNYGYNRQGSAVYHELVFKNRRSGCKDKDVDFTPGLSSVPDNDPQGLAIRVALAQQKKFFTNRPWFKELDSLAYQDMATFADNMIAEQIQTEATDESPIIYKTDSDYISDYKLNYETYANSFNQPL